MLTKQTWLRSRGRLWQTSVVIGVVLLVISPARQAFATGGTAGFAFADNNSTFKVGGTIDVELLESGTNVQTVWANLSYPTSRLQFQQANFDNSLDMAAAGGVNCSVDPASGNGRVSLRCTALTPANGTEIVADLRFAVAGPGTATLAMAAGGNSATDITDSTGSSIWDGSLPHVTYTLQGKAGGAAATVPPGVSNSGSGNNSTGGGTPASNNIVPGSSTSIAQGPNGSLDFAIADALGRPLGGARVAINDNTIHYTDTEGKTDFSLAAGTYRVSVTAPGMVARSFEATVATSGNKRLSMQLSPAAPGAALGLFAIIILAAYFGRSRLHSLLLMLPFKQFRPAGSMPVTGIVVGDGGLTSDSAPANSPLPQPPTPPAPSPLAQPSQPPTTQPPYPGQPR